MKTLVVIPARFASTRFPGKPLAMLGGKPILQWVWEAASSLGVEADCVIATDDGRIADMAETVFDANVMMTSTEHQSGTDRCGEVVRRMSEEMGEDYDLIVNLQGDEPFVRAADIRTLVGCFANPQVEIATLRRRIESTADLASPNCVKVVCASDGKALYFSRQPIPFRRDVPQEEWLGCGAYYKHIGMYAFRRDALLDVCRLPQSALEKSEKLEQLRWLEAGYRIAVAETDYEGVGIDTPDDLKRAEAVLENRNN